MPNVYDWDKTIVSPDSTAQFFYFCLRRHPALLRYAPWQLAGLVRYLFARGFTKTQAKAAFYHFLRGLPHWEQEVALFWRQSHMRPKAWYLAQMRPDDIIISASPEFLLRPMVRDTLRLRLIASRVDPHTGATTGENCHGQEKVRRLREAYGDVPIQRFYSDSRSDAPLAKLAAQAFLVKGDAVLPWDES
ncbi:MAG: haloacid dehalogenase-like hydrolase [Oscillospiraceae bacterium]|jgi:phosphoserine phosphatase|nr:haloacid dehalogenase-like hydrolase [Oscillospiraceae bacterium]